MYTCLVVGRGLGGFFLAFPFPVSGKFIYISPEEYDRLAEWMKRRGRVSISDVVNESNKLIDLTPEQKVAPTLSLDDEEPSSSTASASATS